MQINEKQYDATTGKIIGTAKKVAHQVKSQSGGVIDGFMRKPRTPEFSSKKAAIPKPKLTAVAVVTNRPVKKRPARSANKLHARAERSRTLMRAVVARPTSRLKAELGRSSTASSHPEPQNPARLLRAIKTARHAQVSRFGGFAKSAKDEPQIITPKNVKVVGRAPTASTAGASVTTRRLPSMMTSASHNQLERLLDHALAKADAHKQILRGAKANKNFYQRLKSLPKPLVAILAIVVGGTIGGFLAWNNLPQFAVKIASARTGISAVAPSYVPSGFKFAAPVATSDKSITVRYRSTGDSALSFALVQKSSNMDSEALSAKVIPANSQVQTSQVDGTTVFIHGRDNDATWVNRGIWYTIDNDASLSSSQLLRIVQSL